MLADHPFVEAAIALAIGCAVAAALGIKLLWPLLVRYALARPNARSSHKVPTPQGAGASIVLVSSLGVIVAASWLHLLTVNALVILGACLALAVVGALDDILVLRALPRFVCQLGAAIVVIWTVRDEPPVFAFMPALVERIGLVLALVWFVNLVNFMDGIDLITVVEVVPLCAGAAIFAYLGAAPPIALLFAIALGAGVLGFAPFNRPPARVFLGDVGSLPIGLWLGWLLILLAVRGHAIAAIVMPLYYLADATLTLLRRALRRERFWEAHRTHFYQRATDRGLSVIQIDIRILVVNVVLVALAVVTVVRPSSATNVICLVVAGVVVTALLLLLQRGRR